MTLAVTTSTDPPAPSHDSAPRSAGALLVDRTFGPFFAGNLISNTGNWLYNVAAAVVVYELTASALLVGMVSVSQFALSLLLAPFAGAWSDRVDRRRLLLAGEVVAGTSAGVLSVAALTLGVEALGVWPILLATLGIGLGQAIAATTLNALVPSLVTPRDLPVAVSLTSLTFSLGRALGPAMAGLALVTVGAAVVFAINAVSYLALIGALLVIRARPSDREQGDRRIRAALAYVRAHPALVAQLIGVGVIGFAADPVNTLSPALVAELGADSGLTGYLVAAFGGGAALTAAVVGRAQHHLGLAPTAAVGAGILSASMATAGAAWSPAAAIAAMGLAGAGFVLGLTSFTTLLQQATPDELRGRVMALWTMAFLGSRPLAAVIDGAVADSIGVRLAYGVAVVVAACGVVIARRLPGD